MFTGIIEALGKVENIQQEGTNIHFEISSDISNELKIDQSIAHDGVCLTVVELLPGRHKVTAIRETLERTNLSNWTEGYTVNLERCLKLGDRLDGHMVQGHVDCLATCIKVLEEKGSWQYHFKYNPGTEYMITVEKGSVTINGVSLTVVQSSDSGFSVAIIPYTHEHTNFKNVKAGDQVNIEFDILGKYLVKLIGSQKIN